MSAAPFAVVRPMAVADLVEYKRLRDEMLATHPEAFTSDADAEQRKEPAEYLQRLGIERREGGHFLLGAWRDRRLVGAIACERDLRLKVRHVGHVIGMMVRPQARGQGVARSLLDSCIAEARRAGLEMLTLSVTAGNDAAVGLYERCGFVACGRVPRAIKVGATYHDKLQMALDLGR